MYALAHQAHCVLSYYRQTVPVIHSIPSDGGREWYLVNILPPIALRHRRRLETFD